MADARTTRLHVRRSARRHVLPQSGQDRSPTPTSCAFAGLTGDYSELHTSDVYGKNSQFGRRVAHGMLGLAYAHGLMWPRTGELRETAIAFLGISDWKFVAPIFVGDTIFVNYRIAELRDSKSRPTQAIATFDVEVVEPGRSRRAARAQGAARVQGAADCGRCERSLREA